MAERTVGTVAQGTGEVLRPRVVAAAVVARRRWKVVEVLDEVVRSGGSGVLVSADGGAEELDPRVEVVDLLGTEQRTGVNALLSRSPVRLVNRLRGRQSSGPSKAWAMWSASKPYRVIRPWVLWRTLRRRLDEVDVAHVDHIVLVGQESWPIAWHLCRLNPEITVGWDVPDEVYEKFGRTPDRVVS